MKSIHILEIMAGVIAAVAILILGGKWYWAGITFVIGTPCLICFTAAIMRLGMPKKEVKK